VRTVIYNYLFLFSLLQRGSAVIAHSMCTSWAIRGATQGDEALVRSTLSISTAPYYGLYPSTLG
jgi:hypothetical protein